MGGAIILPAIKIGRRIVIGAGSVVSKDVSDNSVVVENPAKLISTLETYLKKNKELMKIAPVYDTY